jgi:hypothetical protein
MKTAEEAQRGGGPRRWRCFEEWLLAPMCPTSQGRIGVRRAAASRGWRGSGRLSPVEVVGDVAWTKSGAEEGFRSPTGKEREGEGAADMQSVGFKLKTNFDINFKSIPN